MTNEECFDAWAPENAVWSRWAKPVLFTQRSAVTPPSAPSSLPAAPEHLWLSQASGRTALIVDLPAVESVVIGLEAAQHGYRPVPLYNTSNGPSSLIPVSPLVNALGSGAMALRDITLRDEAPPAFLLDSNRMKPLVPKTPGNFDNRWVVFPQDFPSGTFLRSRGIADVIVLHDGHGVQEDLAHVLLRWQQAEIRLMAVASNEDAPRGYVATRPAWYRSVWYRAIILAGLRRNNAGGFGGVIPTSGGGGYG